MEWGSRRLSGGPLCRSLEKTESQPGHEKQSFLGIGTTQRLVSESSTVFYSSVSQSPEDALKTGDSHGGDRISNDWKKIVMLLGNFAEDSTRGGRCRSLRTVKKAGG